jgi:hypothetical protein
VGSLLRHGPTPLLHAWQMQKRIYKQGILKYMANAGVSRAEAKWNNDVKLNKIGMNPGQLM